MAWPDLRGLELYRRDVHSGLKQLTATAKSTTASHTVCLTQTQALETWHEVRLTARRSFVTVANPRRDCVAARTMRRVTPLQSGSRSSADAGRCLRETDRDRPFQPLD
ncbi:unnamed protein product [Cercospora beticola]|nr:unnamed protein product [Cercospora beticola]